jgi:hypothetical protein
MLEIDENKRVDFEGLENYLNENFNEEEKWNNYYELYI